MKKLLVCCSLFSLALTAQNAWANDGNHYVPYVGIDYSYSNANAKFLRPNYNAASVILGSDYNRFFSTEVFYQHSDNSKKTSRNGNLSSRFQAGGLDMYGYLPLTCGRDLALVGTLGAGIYDFKKRYSNPYVKSGHDQGYGYRAGAGIFYSLSKNVALRGVARYVKLDKIKDIDHMMEYSAGLRYTFN